MITNPQAVKHCNEKVRPVADLIERTRRTCEQFLIDITTEFEANTSGDDPSTVVDDGASVDGRSVITKQNVSEVKFVAEQIVAAATQDDRATLIANVSVNGQPLF